MNKSNPSPQELIALVEHQAKNNLIDFSIATDRNYKPNWHHEIIGDKLEAVERGDIKRLMIFVPPRHGKSQLASINFPAWYLGRNPEKEVITASYSSELAQDFGSKTRTLVSDEIFKNIFNITLKADEKAKAKWLTNKKGSYTSVGVGGAITGRGADLLTIDDPFKNREEAESKLIRDKVWNWYTSTAYTRLEKGGAIALIMTRWNLDDLGGRLLQAMKDGGDQWEIVSLPAIANVDEPNRKMGEPLWADKYDLEALESIKKTIGIYDWTALYQQSPILTEKQEFRQEWFKYRDQQEVDRQLTRNFLTIDTAISKSASSDYTGLCDNAVDSKNYWNIKAWRMKVDPLELIDLLFTLHERRRYEKIGIEKTIYLTAIKPFLDEEQRKRNKFLPIVELHHNQINKEVRIRGLIPRYSSGSIYHIKGECNDLEEELITFPQAIKDDVSDATAYQLQIAKKPYEQVPRIYKTNEQHKNEAR
jgi:hypothetical protein